MLIINLRALIVIGSVVCAVAGWELASHYGSLLGAYSMLTILPSAGIGIFTSYNGAVQMEPFTINSLLHTRIADIYLAPHDNTSAQSSGDPWWCDVQQFQSHSPSYSDSATEPLSLILFESWSYAYLGNFVHPVLGDLIISFSSSATDQSRNISSTSKITLTADYGQIKFHLHPVSTSKAELFVAVPSLPEWNLTIGHFEVKFIMPLPDSGARWRFMKINFPLFDSDTEFDRSIVAVPLTSDSETHLKIIGVGSMIIWTVGSMLMKHSGN